MYMCIDVISSEEDTTENTKHAPKRSTAVGNFDKLILRHAATGKLSGEQ